MPRLIDANTIFNGELLVVNTEAYDAACAIIEKINKAPTIDAEPVKHGYWGASYIKAFNSSDDISHLHMYCSSCGYHLDLKDTNEDAYRQFKYCPNCGAKMDEVRDE